MSTEAKIISGFGLVSLIILIGGIVLFGNQTTSSASAADLVKSDSYQTGPSEAKVTVVEFADFQCPACASAAPIVEQLQKDYAGKVNFVFRHFPLSIHANALLAASAGEAAGSQGKFWEMYRLLYLNQAQWQGSSDATIVFTGFATTLGLDVTKFKDATSSYASIDKIRRDQSDGTKAGVSSTPTFFVNGTKYVGTMSHAQFTSIIDGLLK